MKTKDKDEKGVSETKQLTFSFDNLESELLCYFDSAKQFISDNYKNTFHRRLLLSILNPFMERVLEIIKKHTKGEIK